MFRPLTITTVWSLLGLMFILSKVQEEVQKTAGRLCRVSTREDSFVMFVNDVCVFTGCSPGRAWLYWLLPSTGRRWWTLSELRTEDRQDQPDCWLCLLRKTPSMHRCTFMSPHGCAFKRTHAVEVVKDLVHSYDFVVQLIVAVGGGQEGVAVGYEHVEEVHDLVGDTAGEVQRNHESLWKSMLSSGKRPTLIMEITPTRWSRSSLEMQGSEFYSQCLNKIPEGLC